MEEYLLLPPVVFIISLIAIWFFVRLAKHIEHPAVPVKGKEKPYACGEDIQASKAAPEYKSFFAFAVFFTILHVAGLMIATWATASVAKCCLLGAGYIVIVGITLAMLFAD